MQREIKLSRKTNETDIQLEVNLDDAGNIELQTGLPFFDHMLNAMARHGGFGLVIHCQGDLEIDPHHTIEDIGLALGQAIREALGEKRGITRYGTSYVPMDEALSRTVLDLSGRPHFSYGVEMGHWSVGGIPVRLFHEFFQAVVNSGGITLHIDLLRGEELHHIFESIFKSFGRAFSQAINIKGNNQAIPSTKGMLD